MVSEEEHSSGEDVGVEDSSREGTQVRARGSRQETEPARVAPPEVQDSAGLIKIRSRARARFTRQVTKIDKAINEGAGSDVFVNMQMSLAERFEECVDLHLNYCAATGRSDDSWITALEADNNQVHDRMRNYLDRGETSLLATKQHNLRSKRRLPEASDQLLEAERVNVPVASQRSSVGSSLSSRSSVSRVSRASHHSSLSVLARERHATELELELTRKRRDEEKAEDERLAKLANELQEEQRRVKARRE